jgi:hypothetical protein
MILPSGDNTNPRSSGAKTPVPDRPKDLKCRHCILMTSGACPYPVARSYHRMMVPAGGCRIGRLDPHYACMYRKFMDARAGASPEVPEGSRRSSREEEKGA